MKKTKVVCTIGPVSENREKLEELIQNGMNVMRMNFSHGDHEEQGARIKTLRQINEEKGLHIGFLLDTKGPEIRTGYLEGDKAVIAKGDTVRVTMDYSFLGNKDKFAISYAGLYDDIHVGGKILIEDGNLTLTVIEKDETTRELVCRAENDKVIKNKRNCNVPGVILNMPFISAKDKDDIEFGCDMDVDFIAASFVRRPQDILDLREVLANKGNSRIKIISKIENQEGVDNMEAIVELSDGVMVARGDLGVDVPAWELPTIQKRMIELAQSQGKIVVTATQMLDSMQQNPRPTRAEVTDVHNAVLDGTSATMLSGESANGNYPAEAVKYMATIDERAEYEIDYDKMIERALNETYEVEPQAAIAMATAKIALEFGATAIVAEGSNDFAYQIARFRPACDVFFAVNNHRDARSLALAWGVQPVVGNAKDAFRAAKVAEGFKKGDVVLLVTEKSVKFKTILRK